MPSEYTDITQSTPIIGYIINQQDWIVNNGSPSKLNRALLCEDPSNTQTLEDLDFSMDARCFQIQTKKVNPAEQYIKDNKTIGIQKENVFQNLTYAPRTFTIDRIQNVLTKTQNITQVVSPLIEIQEQPAQISDPTFNQFSKYNMITGLREKQNGFFGQLGDDQNIIKDIHTSQQLMKVDIAQLKGYKQLYINRILEQCQYSNLTGPLIPEASQICNTNFTDTCTDQSCNNCQGDFCFMGRLQMQKDITQQDTLAPPGMQPPQALLLKQIIRAPQTQVNTANAFDADVQVVLNVNQRNVYLGLSPDLQFVLPGLTKTKTQQSFITTADFVQNEEWGFVIDGDKKMDETLDPDLMFEIGYKTYETQIGNNAVLMNERMYNYLEGSIKDYIVNGV